MYGLEALWFNAKDGYLGKTQHLALTGLPFQLITHACRELKALLPWVRLALIYACGACEPLIAPCRS